MTDERSDAPGSRPNAILPHAQPERAPTDHRARAEAYKAERDRARDLAAHLEQDAHTLSGVEGAWARVMVRLVRTEDERDAARADLAALTGLDPTAMSSATVSNPGDVDVYPVWTIFGPVTSTFAPAAGTDTEEGSG